MKYYLTYYEAYPIYEPAEGGYYYEGRNAIKWWESEDINELLNSISNFTEEILCHLTYTIIYVIIYMSVKERQNKRS